MTENNNTNNKPLVLVTGASRGIGQAIADTIAQADYLVIGTATSDSSARQINQRLNAINNNCLGLKLNINDSAEIEKVLTQINDKYQATPLILINNAGITRDNLFMRMKEEEWNDVINTNLSSTFRLTKLCIKSMVKAQYGRIINISSVVALSGNPGQVNYSASKAGLIGFSKSLARELGGRNITANCIAPGFIETDMTNALSENHKNKLLEQIPLAKLGQPQDIANCVLFLIEKGDYITGQTIHINGGMYLN